MFVISELKYIVRIPPPLVDKNLESAVLDNLNEKLANKVITNVGLCIALFDITKMGDSFILPGDGATHTKVDFRCVVFRPFIEEIIVAKVRSCTKEGVQLTLGFFDDIFIPKCQLQHPSRYDETEQVWIWEFNNNGDKHDLFMDPGEKVRFRVVAEEFVQISPAQNPDPEAVQDTSSKIPYTLIGAMNEPGLGVLSWWDGA